jgi:hypothetical protein
MLLARRRLPAEDFDSHALADEWPSADCAISLTASQTNVLLRWIQQHYGEEEVIALPPA